MVEADVLTFAFDRDDLIERGQRSAASYQSADPFPHAVFEDLIPDHVVAAVIDEFDRVDPTSWVHYSDSGNTDKIAVSEEHLLGPATRHLIAQLHSGAAIAFLEALSGITGLVVDPWLVGGGLHELPIGGFLNVHADFNRHPHLRLERRMNLLLYLNPEWQPDWGGELELWAPGDSGPTRTVAPDLGRVVIFNTTDRSLHGNPTPVACPPGRGRRSLALYYYTAPADPDLTPHSTLYGDEAHQGRRAPDPSPSPPRLASRLLPPIVTDALRRVRR